jgi:uncharacterized SAM-binding protein YcdF (DUF218 family)
MTTIKTRASKSPLSKAAMLARIGLVTILACIVLGITVSVVLLSKGNALVSSEPPQAADAIIVLGSHANSDGSPTEVMKMRVGKAVELYKSKFAPVIIFSGSAVANRHIEAEVMARYAMDLGLPASSVILETRSTNTLENALFSKQMLDSSNWSSAIVVTSPYHTLRAKRAFADAGIQVNMVSAIEPDKLPILERIREIAHEYDTFPYFRFPTPGSRKTGK